MISQAFSGLSSILYGRAPWAWIAVGASFLAAMMPAAGKSTVFALFGGKGEVVAQEKSGVIAPGLAAESESSGLVPAAGQAPEASRKTDFPADFPRWVREMFFALRHPLMAVILLLVGFTAAFIEANSPGLGVPGFVALACFGLFFWSAFSDGSASWLELILFVIGAICLILEVAVIPGFGIFGIGGWVLVILSLVLARDQGHWPPSWGTAQSLIVSLFTVSIALVGAGVLALFFLRTLPTPGLEGEEEQLGGSRPGSPPVLIPPVQLGEKGVAITPLAPSGKARFAAGVVDVVSEGEFVEAHQPVEIVEIRGHIVKVRAEENSTRV